MSRIVVSDATALIHLSRIGALHLLRSLYVEIVVPEAVYNEVVKKGKNQPGSAEVAAATWIKVAAVKNRAVVSALNQGIHLGESEAIALSCELNASVLIIDEVAGRAAAKAQGLRIIGMVGILLLAKKAKLIVEVKTYIDALERTGFHLGKAFRDYALKQAGEDGQANKA